MVRGKEAGVGAHGMRRKRRQRILVVHNQHVRVPQHRGDARGLLDAGTHRGVRAGRKGADAPEKNAMEMVVEVQHP